MKWLIIVFFTILGTNNLIAGVVITSKYEIFDENNNPVYGVSLAVQRFDSLNVLNKEYELLLEDTINYFWLPDKVRYKYTYKVTLSKTGYETLVAINPESTIILKKINTKPPELTIQSPDISRGFKTIEPSKQITIKGNFFAPNGIFEVTVNGQEAYIEGNGNFSKTVLLAIGANSFTVIGTDLQQNSVKKTFSIERKPIQQEAADVAMSQTTTLEFLQTGTYYALIIGNNDYNDPTITTLNQPINDATKLYNVLTTHYSFDTKNVTFLKNASYLQMIEAFDDLSNKITPNDNLLVFYAGHGWWDEVKNLGYWLPCDAKKNSTAYWIANSLISDYMGSINSKHTLLIADACFSGSIFKTRSAFADAQPAINKLYEMPSKKAMTSGNLKEVPDKSMFLYYLAKRLEDNTEKYISSDMLFASFRQAVLNNSPTEPQYGIIQNAGDEGGEFIFIRK